MLRAVARFTAVCIALIAVITVSTASHLLWHNPVPEELLKKKS